MLTASIAVPAGQNFGLTRGLTSSLTNCAAFAAAYCQVRTTRAGIVDYFSNFLKLSPQGKVDQSTIRLLSPDVALHSGVYSFTLNPAEGETKIVQVRRQRNAILLLLR